ncbi:unnamed protein product [Rotaria sp. Silwood2]|nr:unnamed protein product [Rotaria sp. Silwood2]CAF3420370.1 unnamed protein product [Rotaria sp. Silwood2]CAF3487798.1 unnamed protein product [Rotaria sp. Silwood2]CAF4042676.1 unnamed protein product [Rotaria sp. Silwood2]CAF4418660.1 unnamed protein product [Rotaria sp. Silwood2]
MLCSLNTRLKTKKWGETFDLHYRARLGVPAFDESLIMISKSITQNAGYDQQKTIVKLQQDDATSKRPVGIDITTDSRRDMILKQYTEQIFIDLYVRITNNLHQQQNYKECTTNTTVVILMID